jgi:hypothetical protein
MISLGPPLLMLDHPRNLLFVQGLLHLLEFAFIQSDSLGKGRQFLILEQIPSGMVFGYLVFCFIQKSDQLIRALLAIFENIISLYDSRSYKTRKKE